MLRRSGLACLAVSLSALVCGGCIDSSVTETGGTGFDAGGLALDASVGLEGGPVTRPDGGAADAGPMLVTGATTLDFGLVDCASPPPAPETFGVKNVGGRSVHYALGLSATDVFAISGPTSGDVAPGDTATITIGAAAVPASTPAGQVDTATLTITTDDPNFPTAQVTLQRTAHGATIAVTPDTTAFGDVPVSSTSSPLPIVVRNVGNADATVTLHAPSDPRFATVVGGAHPIHADATDGGVEGGTDGGTSFEGPLPAGGALPTIEATFAPTASGAAQATATMDVTGPVCGASATSFALTGNGTIGVVAVTPGSLDFGKVSCGATGSASTVTVKNSGSAAFTWSAQLLAGAKSPYAVAPTTGKLAPGATATVTVTPAAIPSVASVATDAFADTLRITSDAVGDANHDVALHETALGAVLSLDHTSLAFGDQPTSAPVASLPFTITNSGTLPASFSMTTSSPFSVETVGQMVTAGAPLTETVTFGPLATGPQSGQITFTWDPNLVLCSPPIGPIALTGNGTNGALAVSTKALAFGSVACGAQAGAQTFTVSNTGTASFTWTASLAKGASSPYAVSPSSGTLAAGAKTTVTVTPAPIPQTSALTNDLYGDTLTITPKGISGGAAQTIAISETAKGGVITVSAPSIAFGSQPEGQPTTGALTITNTGTMPVTLTPAISGGSAPSFSLATPGAHALAAGASYSPGPTFSPQATGALASSVAFSVGANDVLCQPLPAAVTLGGTGTNGAIALGAASIAVPAQTCGAAATTKTLKLTNGGTAALTWNAKVLGASGFTVSPSSGSLAAGGGTTTIDVISPAFPTTLGNVTTVTDTLRVTTDAFGDGNHDVALSATPSGAILQWGQSSVAFTGTLQAGKDTQQQGFSVKNVGNAAATPSFTLTGGPNGGQEFTFAPQGSSVGGGATLGGTATFTPTYAGTQTNTVGLTVPAGTALCGALPAAIGISGTAGQGTFGWPGKQTFDLWCNAAATSNTVTLTNAGGTAPYDFTASIDATWSVSPANGTVAPNQTVTLTVTPPTTGDNTPGNANNATLSVTTDIPGDGVHAGTMQGTYAGAYLAFSAPTVSSVNLSSSQTATGTLNNTGNASVGVSAYVVRSPNNPSTNDSFTLSLPGNSASIGANTVTYSWTADTQQPYVNYTYDVYFPQSDGTANICSAPAHQTVQFMYNPIG
jgi:hypothetical protein